MKALKIFLTVAILTIAGLAVGDSVSVMNLGSGDYVNKDNFTIVAKGEAFAEGDNLMITVTIINHTSGITVQDRVNVQTK